MGWPILLSFFFMVLVLQGPQIIVQAVSTNFYNYRPSTVTSSNIQQSHLPPPPPPPSSPVRNPNHPTDLRPFNNRKAYGSKAAASALWPSTASRYLTGSRSRPHQFMDRNDEDNTYHWGYDTGSSFQYNKSFREERRDSYGRVWGKYGHVDPNGILHIVEYVADEGGYRTRTQSRFYLDAETPSSPPPRPSSRYPTLTSPSRFRPRPPIRPKSRTDIIRRQPLRPPSTYSDEEQEEEDYQY